MSEAGLRERKKARTRCALTDAAFRLFGCKGFTATTIDEIAEAVEISPRTFFRYFASKEDVVLSLLDEQLRELVATLRRRPATEPVLTALHLAAIEVIRACESGTNGFDAAKYQELQVLIASSPALAAHSLEQSTTRLAELAGVIGLRMGVDHRTDPRPRLVAAVGLCAMQTAVNAWREADRDTKSSDLVDRAFTLIADGIDYRSIPQD